MKKFLESAADRRQSYGYYFLGYKAITLSWPLWILHHQVPFVGTIPYHHLEMPENDIHWAVGRFESGM